MNKLNLLILFGGRSAEHKVSLQSAYNIIEAVDKSKYSIYPVGIDYDGRWYYFENKNVIFNNINDPSIISLNINSGKEVALLPIGTKSILLSLENGKEIIKPDVIFPVLHGPYGEDGTIQALAKMANLPCVGPGIAGSVIGMDKDLMKRLLREAGIPIAKSITIRNDEIDKYNYRIVSEELGKILFVKPANMGSSVGISKVVDEDSFNKAVELAFLYDNKIIVEEEIKGREIECAVLGNENPIASELGEIVPLEEFYSYSAKYIYKNGAELKIPAELPVEIKTKVQHLAIKAFKYLECYGMSRVDFFVTENYEVLVNEINTIPGFTKISMYPKLWEYSGISYSQLIDKLIELSIEKFNQLKKLKVFVE